MLSGFIRQALFYFKYSLKKDSSLSKGIMSVRSYKSVWLAPETIINS